MKKNKLISTKKYFNERSLRYGNALKAFPQARLLDLIPYLFVLDFMRVDRKTKILDVFGGTGFLATSLKNIDASFSVVDGSEGMLNCIDKSLDIEKILTENDLQDMYQTHGENSFDIIFSHGGFHHVIEYTDGTIDIKKSIEKQDKILVLLEKLLKPNGIIVIADISSDGYEKKSNNNFLELKAFKLFKKYLSNSQFYAISNYLNIKQNEKVNLSTLQNFIIKNYFNNSIKYKAPNYFFDEFIAKQAACGHESLYLNFGRLEQILLKSTPLITIDFPTPWVFNSKEDAGLFFREKFSIGKSLEKVPEISKRRMFNKIDKYLGTTKKENLIYVNWGVTYGAYQKGN